jgi:hypothetical protein
MSKTTDSLSPEAMAEAERLFGLDPPYTVDALATLLEAQAEAKKARESAFRDIDAMLAEMQREHRARDPGLDTDGNRSANVLGFARARLAAMREREPRNGRELDDLREAVASIADGMVFPTLGPHEDREGLRANCGVPGTDGCGNEECPACIEACGVSDEDTEETIK